MRNDVIGGVVWVGMLNFRSLMYTLILFMCCRDTTLLCGVVSSPASDTIRNSGKMRS